MDKKRKIQTAFIVILLVFSTIFATAIYQNKNQDGIEIKKIKTEDGETAYLIYKHGELQGIDIDRDYEPEQTTDEMKLWGSTKISDSHIGTELLALNDTGQISFGGNQEYNITYNKSTNTLNFNSNKIESVSNITTNNLSIVDKLSLPNTELINSASDLPDPVDGFHQLKNNTPYLFRGVVSSSYGIEVGQNSPILGFHGGTDGFIHTGGNTAFRADNNSFFMRDFYAHAPSGRLFNLNGTVSDEILIQSCSYSDAPNLGDMANLGKIDGYRVPTIKNTNFEHFDGGLNFTGKSNKIFIADCPIRNIDTENVTIFTFNSRIDTRIVDIINNYVKFVKNTTKVIKVKETAIPSEIFQYRGNTHGESVVKENILTGQAGVNQVGFRVTDSYPLANSEARITLNLYSQTTITIDNVANDKLDQDNYTKISGDIRLGDVTCSRFIWNDTYNNITYKGKRETLLNFQISISVGTGNTDTISLVWFQNGNIINSTATSLEMSGVANGVDKMMVSSGVRTLQKPEDTLSVAVANLDSTTDITISDMNVAVYSIT